jgi:hypothetical protein
MEINLFIFPSARVHFDLLEELEGLCCVLSELFLL